MNREVDSDIRSQENQASVVNLTLTRLGLGRLLAPLVMGPNDLPGTQGDAFDAITLAPRQYETFASEVRVSAQTSAAVLAARPELVHMPVTVVSADQSEQGPRERAVQTHADLAALSEYGHHVVVPETDHMGVVLDKPGADIVSEEVLRLFSR